MTNTAAFLDSVEDHDAFAPFQTSSGDEGFEFFLLVTPVDWWNVQDALWPFIEAREVDLVIEYRARTEREYGDLMVTVRNAGLVEVGQALLAVYDRLKVSEEPVEEPVEEPCPVRHTICKLCGLDLEVWLDRTTIQSFDRGSATTCPDGLAHDPVLDADDLNTREYYVG